MAFVTFCALASEGSLPDSRKDVRGFAQKGAKITKVSELPFRGPSLVWIVTGTPLTASATLRLDEDLAKHPNLISLCDLCDLLCRFSLFSTEGIRTEGHEDHKGFGVAFPRTELGLDRDPDAVDGLGNSP